MASIYVILLLNLFGKRNVYHLFFSEHIPKKLVMTLHLSHVFIPKTMRWKCNNQIAIHK